MQRIGYILDLDKEKLKYFEERCKPDHDHSKNLKLMTFGHDLYSDNGFISDTDSLYDVCLKDDKYVKETLGEDGHNIISKIIMVLLSGDTFTTRYPKMNCDIDKSKYEVRFKSSHGCQYCPFVDINIFECGNNFIAPYIGYDYLIINKKAGKYFKINTLQAHLIYHHHFYQGNVNHRIPPQDIIEFFELKKKIDNKTINDTQ